MCGIAGFFSPRLDAGIARSVAKRMADAIAHRGPDSEGVWLDRACGIAIAHRRLAIIDISANGAQPMISHGGRFVVAFNGEIYNFRQVRERLDAKRQIQWKGTSDTEVLLEAIHEWGLSGALRQCVGMFALCLWDRQERRLSFARDRFGEKPLSVATMGGSIIFGSELSALRRHPDWKSNLSLDSIASYLRLSYVPSPYSVFENVRRVAPGTVLSTVIDDACNAGPFLEEPYWSVAEDIEPVRSSRNDISANDAVTQVEAALLETVDRQMISDVPLGAFLSGGIDSSVVVAMMSARAGNRVKSFTVGFHEGGYNEADDARLVAKHFGTEHHELYIPAKEAIETIPRLSTKYDEPFADSSQLPTLLVSEFARGHVTVALTGDGGDELFSGYNRYSWAPAIWNRLQYFPIGWRQLIARTMNAISPRIWESGYGLGAAFMPASRRQRNVGDKMHKLAATIQTASPRELYTFLISLWTEPEQLLTGGHEHKCRALSAAFNPASEDYVSWMMKTDAATYLPDDILVKVDRASMSVGLEARAPFLDHELVQLVWRLPQKFRTMDGRGKWLLRQVLYKHIPREMVDRPKAGFAIPLDIWLRGPLRKWADSILVPSRLESRGILRSAPVMTKWKEHLSGQRNWQYQIWAVLMLQTWLDENNL